MFLHTGNIDSSFWCVSCFVWKSNYIKIKSFQWTWGSYDLTAPSRWHESTSRSPHPLGAKWDLNRTSAVDLLAPEPMLPHVLTFLQGAFKYPLWHGFKARRQQLASQWPGDPAVETRKSSKTFQCGQRITFPSILMHMHSIARCLSNCSQKPIPNSEQKTICQNKTSNAFLLANRLCCENEAAAESLSWRHNLDNYQIR